MDGPKQGLCVLPLLLTKPKVGQHKHQKIWGPGRVDRIYARILSCSLEGDKEHQHFLISYSRKDAEMV